MPGLETERAGLALGLPVAREIYADRAYTDNGNLVSRKLAGAVIHDADEAAGRVLRMIEEQAILTADGGRIATRIDSICVHGDTPGAIAMAATVRNRIESAGLEIAPLARVVGTV
jgi:UPF0271 protein